MSDVLVLSLSPLNARDASPEPANTRVVRAVDTTSVNHAKSRRSVFFVVVFARRGRLFERFLTGRRGYQGGFSPDGEATREV